MYETSVETVNYTSYFHTRTEEEVTIIDGKKYISPPGVEEHTIYKGYGPEVGEQPKDKAHPVRSKRHPIHNA